MKAVPVTTLFVFFFVEEVHVVGPIMVLAAITLITLPEVFNRESK